MEQIITSPTWTPLQRLLWIFILTCQREMLIYRAEVKEIKQVVRAINDNKASEHLMAMEVNFLKIVGVILKK